MDGFRRRPTFEHADDAIYCVIFLIRALSIGFRAIEWATYAANLTTFEARSVGSSETVFFFEHFSFRLAIGFRELTTIVLFCSRERLL